ncbi:hypothetical protein Lpp221_14522, partial [Lacticaseibacillus paracasei subsp. paracasei Lpp221]
DRFLGDFETVGLAGSKRRHAFQLHLAGDCGVWHGKEIFALSFS